MRASMEKRVAQKEKEKREEQLKELAQKAREDRAGIRQQAGKIGWDLICLILALCVLELDCTFHSGGEFLIGQSTGVLYVVVLMHFAKDSQGL